MATRALAYLLELPAFQDYSTYYILINMTQVLKMTLRVFTQYQFKISILFIGNHQWMEKE
jgi:hypothetical protein